MIVGMKYGDAGEEVSTTQRDKDSVSLSFGAEGALKAAAGSHRQVMRMAGK